MSGTTGQLTEADRLRSELDKVTAERNALQVKLTQTRLDGHDARLEDHENRLRLLQEVATKFNVLIGLFFGNGILSAIALVKIFSK